MTTPIDSPRPLLNWLLRRGSQVLAFQVRQAGAKYQVSISPDGRSTTMFKELCRTGGNAFQLHAACVAAFRDAGWTSVAYR